MHIIQLFLTIFSTFTQKTIFYFLVHHVLFPAKNVCFYYYVYDVFEKSNEYFRSATAKLTKRISAEAFNIQPPPKHDISSQNEVRASRYHLTLKNNSRRRTRQRQTWKTLCSEGKASRQKWLTTLCLSGSSCMHVVNT